MGVGVRQVERRELSRERSGNIEMTTEMEVGGGEDVGIRGGGGRKPHEQRHQEYNRDGG